MIHAMTVGYNNPYRFNTDLQRWEIWNSLAACWNRSYIFADCSQEIGGLHIRVRFPGCPIALYDYTWAEPIYNNPESIYNGPE